MEKKEIHNRLEDLYNEFDSAAGDETILTFPKAYRKMVDDLGSIIQEIEDDIVEETKSGHTEST